MPAEFEPHDGCWVAWPRRADVWRGGGAPAKAAFAGVVRAIRRFEPVTVVADKEHVELSLRSQASRSRERVLKKTTGPFAPSGVR
jgi:agmatine/peptidylarginine deiminase